MTIRYVAALALAVFLLGGAAAQSADDADARLDAFCKTARLPSDIAICSDPELRALMIERQQAYDQAKNALDPANRGALLADQNGWVKSYPLACGLRPRIRPKLPLAPAIKQCMVHAGQARTAYLRAYAGANPIGGAAPAPAPVAASPAPPAPVAASPAGPIGSIDGGGGGDFGAGGITGAAAPSGGTTICIPPPAGGTYSNQERNRILDLGDRFLDAHTMNIQPDFSACDTGGKANMFTTVQDDCRKAQQALLEGNHRLKEIFYRPPFGQVAFDHYLYEKCTEEEEQKDAAAKAVAAIANVREAVARELDAERAEEQKRYQEAVAAQIKEATDRGYKPIGFDDFHLDGKDLASNETKIAIQGLYLKIGNIEFLMPSMAAIALMQATGRTDQGIGLITDDATRDVRQFLLDCRNNLPAAQVGCQVTLLGHPSMCHRTTLVGEFDEPCLIVEDGWNIAHASAQSSVALSKYGCWSIADPMQRAACIRRTEGVGSGGAAPPPAPAAAPAAPTFGKGQIYSLPEAAAPEPSLTSAPSAAPAPPPTAAKPAASAALNSAPAKPSEQKVISLGIIDPSKELTTPICRDLASWNKFEVEEPQQVIDALNRGLPLPDTPRPPGCDNDIANNTPVTVERTGKDAAGTSIDWVIAPNGMRGIIAAFDVRTKTAARAYDKKTAMDAFLFATTLVAVSHGAHIKMASSWLGLPYISITMPNLLPGPAAALADDICSAKLHPLDVKVYLIDGTLAAKCDSDQQ